MSDDRVLIVGGSFAGLAAAVALRRVGFEVALFERGDALRSPNVGVVMQITAMKALKKLGLLNAVQAIGGAPVQEIRLQSPSGRVLAVIPQSPIGRELGTPGMVVDRAELIGVLAGRLRSGRAGCNGPLRGWAGGTGRGLAGR
jgi:2-polyprenyl-6-methoxyphenol hydroxylase-like FAD-dependent oxidoreductase